MADTGFDKAKQLLEDIRNFKIESEQELESFRIEFLGTKSLIKALFGEIKNVRLLDIIKGRAGIL